MFHQSFKLADSSAQASMTRSMSKIYNPLWRKSTGRSIITANSRKSTAGFVNQSKIFIPKIFIFFKIIIKYLYSLKLVMEHQRR